MLSAALAAVKRLGHSLRRLAGRLPLCQDIPSALCLSHYCIRLTGITKETRMQLSQYLITSRFLIFFHYIQVPYQENTRLSDFCLIWPPLVHVVVKIQSCRSYTHSLECLRIPFGAKFWCWHLYFQMKNSLPVYMFSNTCLEFAVSTGVLASKCNS